MSVGCGVMWGDVGWGRDSKEKYMKGIYAVFTGLAI